MDAIQEMRDEITDLKAELDKLTGGDVHDHGGSDGRADEKADALKAKIVAREEELQRRIVETESADGFKGAKDLDGEAFSS